MIEIKGLFRTYGSGTNIRTVIDDIDINIERGKFTAILGRNGSGKSTLARHINAILHPQKGFVSVDGMDTRNPELVYDIRSKAGMVFQNPESQAVASIVEDDTAFAPENLGLSPEEIQQRVDYALSATGISHLGKRPVNSLSGGQKQLTAIAGILAMKPDYMIFDEGTSMLDPSARRRIINCVMDLKRDTGIGIIWITHYMEEAADADRVIILDNGHIAADDIPEKVFSDAELIEHCGLSLPPAAQISLMLKNKGYPLPRIAVTNSELTEMIYSMTEGRNDQN